MNATGIANVSTEDRSEDPSLPRPAVFIDRDGVIVDESEYPVDRPEKLRLLHGAAAALRRINDAGLPAILITNQAIVARGFVTEFELAAIHRRLAELLDAEAGARLDAIYYCPHYPDPPEPTRVERYCTVCDCRKPAPGLLLRAARENNLDLSRSVFIGDSGRDIEAARRAGTRGILLTSSGRKDEAASSAPDRTAPDFPAAADLALEMIR